MITLRQDQRVVPLLSSAVMAVAFLAGAVEAQETASITGRVIDNQTQQPLAVAQVRVQGVGTGVFTDSDGTYRIQDVPPGTHTVVVEVIGYSDESREVTVTAGQTVVVDFALNAEALALDELVVVAYGTQTRTSVTGAVGTAESEDLTRTAAIKATEALIAKVPGITNRMGTQELGDARPGSGTSIQIRNLGDPLIVIDGVPHPYRGGDYNRTGELDVSPLDDLNPADIESISVLKDASASIYGFRASNGVVLVTTKRGTANTAPRISISGNYGWQNLTAYPFAPAPANAYWFQRSYVETEQNRGLPRSMPAEELDRWRLGTEPGYESYNQYDVVINNPNAAMYNLNTNVSGGVGNATYYLSMGRARQDYVMEGHTFNRTNLQANFRANVFEDLVLGAQLGGSIENRDNVALPEREDVIYTAMLGINSSWPTDNPWANSNRSYVNGDVRRLSRLGSTYYEDVAGWIRDDRRGVTGNFFAEYTLPFGTQVRAAYSQSYRQKVWERHRFTYDAFCYEPETDTYAVCATGGGNERNKERFEYQQQYAELRLSHSQQLGAHSLSGTAAFEASGNEQDGLVLTAVPSSNFNKLVEFVQVNELETNWSKTARQSFLGRLAYSFADKYFVEATGRYDGSYLYTEDNRWGFFPGVLLAWRPTEESFLRDRLGFLDDLKIRASWGEAGQELGVGPWDYLGGATYGIGGGYQFDGQVVTGVRPRGLPVTQLSWVTSTSRNLGLDIVMLGNRLSAELDLFERKRTGLPEARYDVLLPAEVGYELPDENLESDATQGFESRVTYNDQAGAVSYSVSANAVIARQKILSTYRPRFGSSWDRYVNGDDGRWEGADFQYELIGQFQSMEEIENYPVNLDGQGNRTLLPGDWIFKDVNGDGVLNEYDQRPRGFSNTGQPIFMYGANLSAGYRGFNLSLDFSGAGLYSYRQSVESRVPFQGDHNSQTWMIENRWRRADPYDDQSEWTPGELPPLRRGLANHYANSGAPAGDSDAYRTNVWYLRLKRIELGYSLPARITEAFHIASGRVILSYDNPLTWDNLGYLNTDPEVVQDAALRYPNSKIITVGFSAVLGG